VAANHHTKRKRYWKFWHEEYVEPFVLGGVDNMLTDVPDPNRINLLLGFVYRVWKGD
jgi:hypothetical protein